jgi:hypothetical protein
MSDTSPDLQRGQGAYSSIQGGYVRIAIGIIFGLFIICFAAIVIEELFLGGKSRRRAENQLKERLDETNTNSRA